MKLTFTLPCLFGCSALLVLAGCAFTDSADREAQSQQPKTVRVATFNVSMDGSNYSANFTQLKQSPLPALLAKGEHPQIHNIATIIQNVRPDILLLNEFDYTENWRENVALFQQNFLNVAHGDSQPIQYQYSYSAPVNTGVASPYDFDGDGKKTSIAGDAYGFGFYPGQYGMVLLSRYEIDQQSVRQFMHLKWHQQQGSVMPMLGEQPFYDDETWQAARLSSKSFWDIPLDIDGERVHVLASHPTPPVFDGPEDRNGLRNFAEIKLLADYISANSPAYLVDDAGVQGGLEENARFVILGDLNAAPQGGKARPKAINQLLHHSRVDATVVPASEGAAQTENTPYAQFYTASWRARADYVLPSKNGFKPLAAGVYWPKQGDENYPLVKDRKLSSDHKLVWVDLEIVKLD